MTAKKIISVHVYPPIPVRCFDWEAHYDGQEQGPIGWGETEEEAIENLTEHEMSRDAEESQ